MGNRLILVVLAAFLSTAVSLVLFPSSGPAQDVPRISIEQVNRKLGSDNFIVIDSRSGSDWRGSSYKIKGALRGKPGQESVWAAELPKSAEIVVYCA